MIEWIIDFYREWFVYPRKHFLRFLKRLYKWLPVLWNDEDWDSFFLLKIMQFKIKQLREQIFENDRHTRCERDCKNMLRAERMIEQLIDDDGENTWDTAFTKRHQLDGLCTCPENIMEFTDHPGECGGGIIKFNYCEYCAIHKRKAILQAAKIEQTKRDYVFKFIAKHSPAWWD